MFSKNFNFTPHLHIMKTQRFSLLRSLKKMLESNRKRVERHSLKFDICLFVSCNYALNCHQCALKIYITFYNTLVVMRCNMCNFNLNMNGKCGHWLKSREHNDASITLSSYLISLSL